MILFDEKTRKWFEKHLGAQTTLERCDECGVFFKPELGHKCKKEKQIGNFIQSYER